MSKKKFLLYIFLIILLLPQTQAYANNIATIDNIQINSKGANATKAREKAISKGQKEAFYKLISRIIINKDEKEIIEFPSEKKIKTMVYSIEIQNEKVVLNKYSATINITFNMDIVTKVLQKQKISYIDESSAPILILPVLYKDNEIIFWDVDNPFKNIWKKFAQENIIMSYVIPTGKEIFEQKTLNDPSLLLSMNDLENILYEDYKIMDFDIISQLKKIYKAEQVFLVAARSYRISNRNYYSADIYFQLLTSEGADKKTVTYRGKENLPEQSLLLFATRDISQKIEDSWKNMNKNSFRKTLSYKAIFPIVGLSHLISIKNKLKTLSFLKKFEIKELDIDKVLVEVYFNIQYEEFLIEMKKNNFKVINKDGYLFVTYENYNLNIIN